MKRFIFVLITSLFLFNFNTSWSDQPVDFDNTTGRTLGALLTVHEGQAFITVDIFSDETRQHGKDKATYSGMGGVVTIVEYDSDWNLVRFEWLPFKDGDGSQGAEGSVEVNLKGAEVQGSADNYDNFESEKLSATANITWVGYGDKLEGSFRYRDTYGCSTVMFQNNSHYRDAIAFIDLEISDEYGNVLYLIQGETGDAFVSDQKINSKFWVSDCP